VDHFEDFRHDARSFKIIRSGVLQKPMSNRRRCAVRVYNGSQTCVFTQSNRSCSWLRQSLMPSGRVALELPMMYPAQLQTVDPTACALLLRHDGGSPCCCPETIEIVAAHRIW